MEPSHIQDLNNYWRDEKKQYFITLSINYLEANTSNLEAFFNEFPLVWKER